MESKGLSNTLQYESPSNSGVLAKSGAWPRATAPVALVVAMLSVYAMSGSPAFTGNTSGSINNVESMVSITETKAIEVNLKTQDYSFISAMGFEDDSVSYPDMFS